MKNFTKRIASLGLYGVIFLSAYGQENIPPQKTYSWSGYDYKAAIGARFTNGMTLKNFFNPTSAIEGILTFGNNPVLLTGLYEKHLRIHFAPGLKCVFGLGGHIGFFRYRGYYYWLVYDYGNRVFYVDSPSKAIAVGGMDLIVGLDYKLRNTPINIGLDAKPFIDFYRGTYEYFDGALSLRLAF